MVAVMGSRFLARTVRPQRTFYRPQAIAHLPDRPGVLQWLDRLFPQESLLRQCSTFHSTYIYLGPGSVIPLLSVFSSSRHTHSLLGTPIL